MYQYQMSRLSAVWESAGYKNSHEKVYSCISNLLNATTVDTCKPWQGRAWVAVQEEGSDDEDSDPGGDDGTVLGYVGRLEQKSLLAPTCDFEQESMCGANGGIQVQWATGSYSKHKVSYNQLNSYLGP
jgi:hypothetical protein